MNETGDKKLFWACWIALIATAFGFIVRALIMDEWGKEFNFDKTRQGQLFGVGLWPFAISIVLFSLIIDKIGYGKAMIFAFVCHVTSIALTIYAPMLLAKPGATPEEIKAGYENGYWMLYLGNFIVALGNGTVEAVINPVVATMFARDKTKWLNILHAGWPGGLVLGGLLVMFMGDMEWKFKVGLLAIPVLIYGVMMMTCKFPVSERVAAGVSYRDMLKEVGFLGALIVTTLITLEVTNVFTQLGYIFVDPTLAAGQVAGQVPGRWDTVLQTFQLPLVGAVELTAALKVKLGIILGISVLFGLYTLSLGRFLFVFLLLIMIPLAITELGTDSWITPLMEPEMVKLGLKGGYVLIYTSAIMLILRFFAGSIVHAISPLGLLAVSALLAAVGLVCLSQFTGIMILVAATIYGFGKTFFWPTMLGVVAEQFPKGGALTLNITGGVGMLAVGILGNPLLGNIQDKEIDAQLKEKNPALYAQVMGAPKPSLFGTYQPVDNVKLTAAGKDAEKEITTLGDTAKKSALKTVAIFPCIMLASYLLLILYFKSRGGYRPEDINAPRGEYH